MIKRNIVGELSGSVLNKLSVNGTSILNGETQLSPNGGNVIWSWNTRYFGNSGNLSIGSQADNGFKLNVNGTTRLNGSVQIAPSGGDVLFSWNTRYFGATGNLSIGSQSDSGYKLDVNGNARIVGTSNVSTSVSDAVVLSRNGNLTVWAFRLSHSGLGISSNSFVIKPTTSSPASDIAFKTTPSETGVPNLFISGTSVAVNTNSIRPSCVFQIDSTTQGFLPPRMTSIERNAIVNPATGLVVYQTDAPEGIYTRKSTGWVQGV